MIERTGVQPHAARGQRPGVAPGAGEQVFSEAAPELGSDDPEIRDLHGIVLRDAAELVPPREIPAAPCNEQVNSGIREVLADFFVRPVPPIEPMERFTDRAIAGPVELRRGIPGPRDRNVGKLPESRLELVAILEL